MTETTASNRSSTRPKKKWHWYLLIMSVAASAAYSSIVASMASSPSYLVEEYVMSSLLFVSNTTSAALSSSSWQRSLNTKTFQKKNKAGTFETTLPEKYPPLTPQDGIVVPDGQDTFAACLLVMDDNFRLSEWIAYHYFALNLRFLVVLDDPRSRQPPTAVLERWKPLFKAIYVWNVTHLDLNATGPAVNGSVGQMTQAYIGRQPRFYKYCARFLKSQNQTWTTFTDTDEFITMDETVVPDAQTRIRQPGSIVQIVQETRNITNETAPGYDPHFRGTCYTLSRTLYSAVESTPQEIAKDVPDGFDPRRLETLRWRYRALIGDSQNNGLAKSVADVSRTAHLNRFGIHAVVKTCPDKSFRSRKIIHIQHYLGNWESYSFRDDSRKGGHRNRHIWEFRSNLQDGGATDQVRPWLAGFVETVGERVARTLLHDAGLPPDYRGPENHTGFLLPDDIVEHLKVDRRDPRYAAHLRNTVKTLPKNATLVAA